MAMGACYDDEGNYDYHELDEVVIDTVGANIQPQYAIMRFDTLRLQPNIFFNGKRVANDADAPLDYLWTIYSATTGAGAIPSRTSATWKLSLAGQEATTWCSWL